MQPNNLNDLLEKYHNGTATNEERALVEAWYLKYNDPSAKISHEHIQQDQEESLSSLLHQINYRKRSVIWPILKIAASLFIFAMAGIYFVKKHKPTPTRLTINKPVKNDLLPGGYKATITLSNGSKIVLSDIKNGKLASQGNTVIRKTADGKIIYSKGKNDGDTNALVYNTASTQRGGIYQFVLSDGTKVWLNSSSSIKYPVDFIGNERRVELTGEAYFEVAHNAKKPFRVVTNGQTVEDIGTSFNINAYTDENAIKTTLVEGSVKVSSASANHIIKPGEQVQLKDGNMTVVNADLDKAVAWKNGLFYFDDNNIQEVMRQLARWYDVDVKYDGQLSARRFSGEISRNVNASQILDILSFKKIHYKIEGKTITVLP